MESYMDGRTTGASPSPPQDPVFPVLTRSQLPQLGLGLAAPSFGSQSDPNSMSGRSPSKRTKLADITNKAAALAPRKRGRSGGDEPESQNATSCVDANDHIQLLIKENSALSMLLGDRNKIIELRSIELQKLRSALQKSNQQNHQLARTNCHMLAELNLCKKRAYCSSQVITSIQVNERGAEIIFGLREKALQHELGCTGALLKSKTLELKEERMKKQTHKYREANAKEQGKGNDVAANASGLAGDEGVSESKKKTQASRSQSLSSETSTGQVAAREKNDRRKSDRRAPVNLSSEPCEEVEELFEADKATSPACSVIREVLHENGPNNTYSSAPFSSSATEHGSYEEQKVQSGTLEDQHLEPERSSLGRRPVRKAARRVSSYKEVPLNVKMRRPE